MTRRLKGWKVGLGVIIGVLLSNIPTVQLSAQVGHDPGASPYRDIPLHSGPAIFFGHLSGDRGSAGAGTSNATTYGARYELPAGHALQFQFTGALLRGDRFIIDPRADSNSAARRTGPVKSSLGFAEIGMQLRLTGGKTWHQIAPYVGTGLGLMFDVSSPGDTTASGYSFGTKFSLALSSGVRWYPARRVTVTADARAQFWRLKYPVSFHTVEAPDGSRVIPLTQSLTDWTTHPWISLGIGWTF
jgi:hypothetical protein